MSELNLKLFNVIDQAELPEITVKKIPQEGDPVEIEGEMYYVCEKDPDQNEGSQKVGVIPLVVRNPSKVKNIRSYIKCLSIAHRRVQFMNEGKKCDLDDCNEMYIS